MKKNVLFVLMVMLFTVSAVLLLSELDEFVLSEFLIIKLIGFGVFAFAYRLCVKYFKEELT